MEVIDYYDGFNSTVREYLETRMGPQRISFSVVLPITVVYLLIFVSGVVGNVVVCLVIARNSHFHTATNYYLFSLAISDLLILIFGLPNDLKVYWQQYPWVFGEVVCKLRAYIAETTSYASVLTIVAFTVERYIAICHPLFMQTVSTLPRAIKLVISVWIISCLCATPFASYTKINYVEYPTGSGHLVQQSAFCALPIDDQHVNRILLQCSTFVFFCLPMTIIVILYAKIYMKLRNSRFSKASYNESSRYSSSGTSNDSRKSVTRRSISKMLVAVVIAFFICWAPFHAQRLLAVYVDPHSWTVLLRTANEILYYIAGCLYYFSATINPILYSLMSAKYREAFRDTLCNLNSRKKRNGDTSPYRYGRNHSEHSYALSERDLSMRKTSFASFNHKENRTRCDSVSMEFCPNEHSSHLPCCLSVPGREHLKPEDAANGSYRTMATGLHAPCSSGNAENAPRSVSSPTDATEVRTNSLVDQSLRHSVPDGQVLTRYQGAAEISEVKRDSQGARNSRHVCYCTDKPTSMPSTDSVETWTREGRYPSAESSV